jgi:hypothetical protein
LEIILLNYDSTPGSFNMYRKLFLFILSFLIAVVQAKAASPTELIFPIYAFTNVENCRFWSSGVTLFNPNSTVTTVTFNGFDKNGNVIESRSISINPFTSTGLSISFNGQFGLNTGLAIVFPAASGATPAKGKLIHRGTDGLRITEKDIVISANGQVAGMISELLPESLKASSTISGSLEIVFDQEVSIAALQFGFGQSLEEPALQSLSGTIQP